MDKIYFHKALENKNGPSCLFGQILW